MDYPQPIRFLAAGFLAFCLALLHAPAAQAAPRVALLVGNATYADAPLTNPPNDVKAVAQALKDVGFEVRTLTNAGDKQMSRAIRDFGQAAQGAEVALFYFSGHGMQSRGENYLIPVGAQIQHENDLPVEAVSANQVLRWIEEAAPKAAVVILDACRDNPVAVRSKSGSKGLGRMDAPTGTLVAYATAPGTTASDEGYYAQALAKYIREPGLVLEDVFDRVGADVAKRSRNKQLPRLEDGLYEKVYLVPAAGPRDAPLVTPTPGRPAPVASTPAVDPGETAYWAEVKKSDDTDNYAAYLANYPNGRYVADANEYIERDKQAKAAREKLKEDQAWQKAESGGSYASYSAYLQSYPSGRYAKLAELKLKKLGGAARDCPECPEMVQITAGSFTMGSPSGEEGRFDRESPQHRVSVAGFSLSKTEITRGQFAAFVNDTGHDAGNACWIFEGGHYEERSGRNWRNPGYSQTDNHPVACINWQDANAYAQWLARKTGQPYRLPSEAEWEYAARAGTTSARPWGESAEQACRHANVMDRTGKAQVTGVTWEVHACDDGHAYTAPVTNYAANAFGLHDMIGNVWEWVEDCFHDSYSGAPTDGGAWTSGNCDKRVLRGGSWNSSPGLARAADRGGITAAGRFGDDGFRVVRAARTF